MSQIKLMFGMPLSPCQLARYHSHHVMAIERPTCNGAHDPMMPFGPQKAMQTPFICHTNNKKAVSA